MRTITSKMFCLLLTLFVYRAQAQLSGSYTVTSDFPTLAAAITSLNVGSVSGPVTINIPAGYTETVVTGGYTLTATGTAANPIIFQKSGSGANPLIKSYTGGTGTPSTAFQDGVWRIVGSDYVTIDGIDIQDVNTTNPATMEFGIGFFKASTSNGCQNNTVKNCVITLNRINNATGTSPAADGSRGIEVVNATISQHITSAGVLSAAAANSNNQFYSNTIQNCNIGISLSGYSDSTPYSLADSNNDVGGNSAATGNTFINFGGGASATNPAIGVRAMNQYNLNVSNNYIYNNDGNGVNHAVTLRGVYLLGAPGAVAAVNNNTIILTSGGTTQLLCPIENNSGSGATGSVTINDNLITNCAYPGATSGIFYGIYNNAATPAVLRINNNTFNSNSTNATSGSFYNIYNTGNVTGTISIANNLISMGNLNAATSLALAGIYNTGGSSTTTLSVISNTFQNANYGSNTGTGNVFGVYNDATQAVVTYSNNRFSNLIINSSGAVHLMNNNNATPRTNIIGNTIVTGFSKTVAGNALYGYFNAPTVPVGSGTVTISGNNFSNINLLGGTMFLGINHGTNLTQTLFVSNNTISNVTISGTGTGILRAFNILKTAPGSIIQNNVLTNYVGLAEVTGIYGFNTTGSGDDLTIQINTIGSYTSTGTEGVTGIIVATGTNVTVRRNKIYGLQVNNASGNVIGLNVTGGATHIQNNIIGDLKNPIANSANAVIGINLLGGTTHNVIYNTVYLNTTSSGGTFGSSAISVNTSPTVNLINNIFINTSTANGTGKTVAMRRSGASLANYANTSDYNVLYAGYTGAPSPNNLIFYDGTTSYQTLASFKAAVNPREANSLTGDIPFASLVGTAANYLHVATNLPSVSSNAGVPVAGITTDFDNQVRNATTPDIGADEYNQSLTNCNASTTAGSISAGVSTVCAVNSSSITLYSTGYTNMGGVTYSWQVSTTPGGPYSNVSFGTGTNTPIYDVGANAPAGTYYFIMVASCSVSASYTNASNVATIVINPTPTISIAASSPTICSGSTATLTASGTGVSGTYTWNAIPPATTNTYVISPNLTTTYSVTGTSSAGCTSTLTQITLTVIQTPNTAPIANPPAICEGVGTSTLTGASPSATSWTWTAASGVIATTSDVAVSPTVTTTYSVTRDVNGECAITNTVLVTVNPIPTLNINLAPVQVCAGSQATVFPQGATIYTLISPTSTNGPITGSVTVNPTITVTYTLLGLSSAGCYSDAVNTLTVLPVPVLTLTPSTTVECQNTSVTLTGDGADTYTWLPGPITNSQAIVTPPLVGINNYTLIGAGTNGCSTMAVQQVSVRPVPNLNLTVNVPQMTPPVSNPNNIMCVGRTATLIASVVPANPVGGISYSWDFGPTTTTVTVSPVVSTAYTLTGTFNSTGCSSSITRTVNVFTPTITTTPSPTNICKGSFITLSADGASAPNNYTWTPTNAHTSTISVSPTITTVYTVSAISFSSPISCPSTKTIQLIVYDLPTVTVSADRNPICQNEFAVMTASGALTYTWTGGVGTTSTVSTQLNSSEIYTVTGFDEHNCSDNAVIQMSVGICYGINEIEGNAVRLDIYPNPSSGAFTIHSDADITLSIISEIGQTVRIVNLSSSNNYNMEISELASGIYFVVGRNNEGTVKKKIVITK